MEKYIKDEAYDIYALNFSTLAFIKAAEIFMLNKEMIFRAIDLKYENKVKSFEFTTFLKDILKMNDEFIKPIVEVLDPENKGVITK